MKGTDLVYPIKGTKVHYTDPYTGKIENGIIQTFVPVKLEQGESRYSHITEVFVVYESGCGGRWDKFQDFTAQRTLLENLNPGWKKTLNWDINKLIKQATIANRFRYDY